MYTIKWKNKNKKYHTVGTVLRYILELFRQCGILELFRQCGILEPFRQWGILELFRQCGILELFRQCGILELFRQCGVFCFCFSILLCTFYFIAVSGEHV
jgi:hypothetical protein